MRTMALPFQCLIARNSPEKNSGEWALFGASGSRVFVQTSDGGASTWPADENHSAGPAQDEQQEPSAKRIKLSQLVEHKANFSNLLLSNNKQYLVAVTGEDKCIRVFSINSECRLEQLSERAMTRRPSSIALTSDDSTILCADKFGDVYALPLLPSADDEQPKTPEVEETESLPFVPSASVLTVHSGRNRKTLEEQLKQKSKQQAKSKETLKFKHDLLLGHVSMLTDIVFATVESRSYLITADRDEHIRISRGPPQAHIIEGFCYGHQEFVSRLCLTHSGALVSGGGDAYLFVWDWQNYRLLQKLDLRDAVLSYLRADPQLASSLPTNEEGFKVAVSGIWNVPKGNSEVDEILVACEGVPALFRFNVGGSSGSGEALRLSGNALDVAFINSSGNVRVAVVSVDHVHKPGSTAEIRSGEGVSRLQHFATQGNGQWQETAAIGQGLGGPTVHELEDRGLHTESGTAGSEGKMGDGTGLGSTDEKAVRDMLYHVENLRKRPGAED